MRRFRYVDAYDPAAEIARESKIGEVHLQESIEKEIRKDAWLRVNEPTVKDVAWVTAMREELAGLSPSPLEKLLVDRIIGTWLHLQHADGMAGQVKKDSSIRYEEFLTKRQDRASRRHLMAIAALTTYRKPPSGDNLQGHSAHRAQ